MNCLSDTPRPAFSPERFFQFGPVGVSGLLVNATDLAWLRRPGENGWQAVLRVIKGPVLKATPQRTALLRARWADPSTGR